MAITIGHAPQFIFDGTLTFSSVTNSTTNWAEQTVTLPNSAKFPNTNGLLMLQLPSLQANLAFCNVYPASATTFKVRFFNATGGNLTPTGTSAKLVML